MAERQADGHDVAGRPRGSAETTVTSEPTAGAYDATYFATLYGSVPAQTVADRLRDALLRSLVYRYEAGGALLDIGCGFGYLLEGFADHFQLHGTDISAHAVAAAGRRLARARVVVADVQDGIPFRRSFDVILAVNVMEHLPRPEVAMAAIARALKPGGLFVTHLPTISSPLAGWFYDRSYARDRTHVYRPSGAEFNRLVIGAGFRVLHARYFPFWPDAIWRRLRPHPSYLAVFRKLPT